MGFFDALKKLLGGEVISPLAENQEPLPMGEMFQRQSKMQEFLNKQNMIVPSEQPEGTVFGRLTQDDAPQVQGAQARDDYETYKNKVYDLYRNQLGTAVRDSTDLPDYFPILQEPVLKHMYDSTISQRPGTEYLLPAQALYESTGGRATGGSRNLFGTLPQGEGGAPSQFQSFTDSIDYQLSPNVLGGGVNDSLNILKGEGAISEEELRRIYESYNPNSPYIDDLIQMIMPMIGGTR